MILLKDEEIIKEVCSNCPDTTREDFECEECKQQINAATKAQLKKVVEELEERAEIEHEHCGNSCAHRGVSIWFDIYDWQALKKEIA